MFGVIGSPIMNPISLPDGSQVPVYPLAKPIVAFDDDGKPQRLSVNRNNELKVAVNVTITAGGMRVVAASCGVATGERIAASTSGGAFTLSLPLLKNNGDTVEFLDFERTWGTNALTLDGNGSNIEGDATLVCDTSDPGHFWVVWDAGTGAWKVAI